jgi:hypothetical protein
VGSQTQQITVSSETQQIETSISTVEQSVTQQQMRDLPLNGRNPLQLTTLTAGTVLTTAGTESGQEDNTGLSVNGLRATQNTYMLDGTIYVNRFFDSVPTMPNPDALQEFTIQASNYSADHEGAGALVQLSTRSGTDQLHGEAWEFLRNTVVNANNYFPVKNPAGAIVKPPFKLNQFGGTVGGPIFKSKKAFFFFSAEDLQQRSAPTPITTEYPTLAEISGDFTAFYQNKNVVLYNPATGCAFGQTSSPNGSGGFNCSGAITDNVSSSGAGDKIPMDALSKAVNTQYLAAEETASAAQLSSDGTYLKFTSTTNNNIDNTQYLTRLDYALGQNDHIFGRYFYNQDNFQRPFTAPLGFYAGNLFRNQSLTLGEAHVFSPTLTGALYFGFYRGARTQVPEAPGLKTLQQLGQNAPYGSPNESLVPFPGVRVGISNFVNVFSGGALTQDSTSFDLHGQIVKLWHTHTLAMGGDLERSRIDMDDYSYTPGDSYSSPAGFTGSRTQPPTGVTPPPGYTAPGSPLADFYTGYEAAYIMDNGRKAYLREWRPALYVQDDYKATHKLTLNLGLRWDPWMPPTDLNGTLVGFNLANPNFQSTIAPGAPKGLMFVGDSGVSNAIYNNNFKDFSPRVGFAYNVFGNSKTVARGAYGLFYGFPEGLLYQRTDAMQPVDLYLQINNPPVWDAPFAGYSGGDPFPRGHVGPSQFSTYTFLKPLAGGVLNPASHVEYTQAYNFTVEQDLGNGFAMNVGYVGNRAEHVMASRQFNPYVPPTSATTIETTRTYTGLGAVELADGYDWEKTNAVEVNVTRRSHNLTLLANVVWMKTIDIGSSGTEGNAGPSNPYNFDFYKGVADFDQALRFTASANYPFPKFHVNNVLGQVVNGWQANAIVTSQSGLPFSITSGQDNSKSGVSNDLGVYTGVSPARPAGAAKTVWFNKLAFNPNPVPSAANNWTQSFGNVPRNSLRGPGYEDTDISLFKDIMGEHRVHGQFQAQAFNAWNHTNFANPSSAANAGTFGTITATSSSTGTVNTPSQVGTQRVWQFAAKIIF